MAGDPIFVHSLFRAGSTYVFSRLRSCPELFCYYEPMHELVAWAGDDIARLEIESRPEKMQQLHHPAMSQPYFDELKSVWPSWQQSLPPEVVYGGYFAESPEAAGRPFYDALRSAAPRRPVFSECRTAGRIPILKESVGGHHAYLWRNPWDQWWSYQIDPYFDAASRVIVHADPLPQPLRSLSARLGMPVSPRSTFSEARDYYDLRPLSFEDSYAWFYGLWLYLLDLANSHADLLINIDSLSASQAHRSEIGDALKSWGVSTCDFSNAHSPAARYTDKESTAFAAIESQVHDVFGDSGWDAARLEALQTLRQAHAPRVDHTAEEGHGGVGREALLARRAQYVARTLAWRDLYDEQSRMLAEAQHDVGALHRALDHDRRVLAELKGRVEVLSDEAELRDAELALAQLRIEQLVASLSWRITLPLRRFAETVTSIARATGNASRPVSLWRKWVLQVMSRFPRLSRWVSSVLARAPRLRSGVMKMLGAADQGLTTNPHVDPEMLGPRGRHIYNMIAAGVSLPPVSADDSDHEVSRD